MNFIVSGCSGGGKAPDLAALRDEAERLLRDVGLAAYAVVDDEGLPRANTAYTAYLSPRFACFFSPKSANHVVWLQRRANCGLALWREPSQHGEGLEGAQLRGRLIAPDAALRQDLIAAYGARFPATVAAGLIAGLVRGDDLAGDLYCVALTHGTFLLEPHFGRRNYISVEFVESRSRA